MVVEYSEYPDGLKRLKKLQVKFIDMWMKLNLKVQYIELILHNNM